MIVRFILTMLAMVTIGTTTAFAMDIAAAKSQGLIGETPIGLVEVVNPPGNAELQKLVQTTNQGRLEMYTETAVKQNASVDQVQAVAGAALIEKTPSGQFVKTKTGNWVRK